LDAVIPITDEMLLPLAARRAELPESCQLAAPAESQLRATVDKLVTLEIARQVGVKVPATRLVRSADDGIRAARELGWPVVLKPRRSKVLRPLGGIDSFNVAYADDEASFERVLAPLIGRSDVLLQEFVHGEGVGVGAFAIDGRPVAQLAHRRLHEVPITGGASSLRETIALGELREPVERLLERLNWTGLAMVEFKVGPDGPVLMEINGRVWGSLPLAHAAGIDFPGLLGDLLLGRQAERPAPADYRVGVRARNLELEVVWLLSVLRARKEARGVSVPPRRAALGSLAGLFDPRIHDDVVQIADPLPALALSAKIGAKLARKALARTLGRWTAPAPIGGPPVLEPGGPLDAE
jgi:predicted ATP-grasp superfamily ATP-dependent carboligase